MNNKSFNIIMTILCILPIVVVLVSYETIPLLSISNAIVFSNYTLIYDFIQDNYEFFSIFNVKNAFLIFSFLPIIIFVSKIKKFNNYDRLDKNIYKIVSYINISCFLIIAFLIYCNIYQLGIFIILKMENQFIYISIALYLCVIALLSKTFPINNVIGFKNRYITTNYEYKTVNKLYTLLLLLLSFICILFSVLSITGFIVYPLIVILYLCVYYLCYKYSLIIYKEEHVQNY